MKNTEGGWWESFADMFMFQRHLPEKRPMASSLPLRYVLSTLNHNGSNSLWSHTCSPFSRLQHYQADISNVTVFPVSHRWARYVGQVDYQDGHGLIAGAIHVRLTLLTFVALWPAIFTNSVNPQVMAHSRRPRSSSLESTASNPHKCPCTDPSLHSNESSGPDITEVSQPITNRADNSWKKNKIKFEEKYDTKKLSDKQILGMSSIFWFVRLLWPHFWYLDRSTTGDLKIIGLPALRETRDRAYRRRHAL